MKSFDFHRIIGALAALLCLSSCGGKHFISDASFRDTVQHTLQERLDGGEGTLRAFYQVRDGALTDGGGYVDNLRLTREETEALEFLYAYMPLADLTDEPTGYYLQNVRAALRTREEMSWGKTVPELLFRHFVLPVRVNNENLDTSRVVFFRELYPRVKDLPMDKAILEVNHWCHEKVTYQPSDGRTSSPLASVRTSLGRCGEESTFTVAALRSVGIPARQVYTPRWAHTDDNHAWVEAWADGKWYFMGACEPEAVLNLGWFNAPASRGLLMHTKVFGHYTGPEEVMLEGPNYTEINLIDNYGSSNRADVLVCGADGTPVPGARVWFMIYNYAEFYPAVSKYTDAQGKTFLTAGKGDMLAWAVKDGRFGFSRIRFAEGGSVTITLSDKAPEGPLSIDIVPPPEQANKPDVTPEQRAENQRRTAREDSLRHAYMDTFLDREEAAAWAAGLPLPKEEAARAARFMSSSMGNHEVIGDFLARHPDTRALDLLGTLSSKDLRDITMENLLDSYTDTAAVLGPRVANEFLTPFKAFFRENLSAEEKARLSQPEELIRWTRENIRLTDLADEWRIPMSPEGVFKARTTFASSRDVFFVKLARSLGIDARKDPVTGKVQYRDHGPWTDVDFESASQAVSPKGVLKLTYTPTPIIDNPQYYTHFTISKITDGTPRLLSFDEGEVDMGGGVSWKTVFRNGASLDTGTYMLTMGNRLSNGSVPVTVQFFTIEEGKTTTVDLIIRESSSGVSKIGDFDAETLVSSDGKSCSLLSMTGRGYYIIGLLGPGQEPTNHALRDIAKEKDALEKWGRPIVLVFPDEAQKARFEKERAEGRYGTLPKTVKTAVELDGTIQKALPAGVKKTGKDLPLFAVTDTFNRVFFYSQGYTIGLGDQLKTAVMKL